MEKAVKLNRIPTFNRVVSNLVLGKVVQISKVGLKQAKKHLLLFNIF